MLADARAAPEFADHGVGLAAARLPVREARRVEAVEASEDEITRAGIEDVLLAVVRPKHSVEREALRAHHYLGS